MNFSSNDDHADQPSSLRDQSVCLAASRLVANPNMVFGPVMVDVSALFDEDDETVTNQGRLTRLA